MPGNIIKINKHTVLINNYLKWYVGDSKMWELIDYLNRIGVKLTPAKQKGK